MEDKMFNSIERYVNERSGLCFSGHKKRLLKQRLEERLMHHGLSELDAYYEILSSSESECLSLLGLLTVNETFFFRNPRQFDYLTEKIIPELEERKGREVMRSWSGSLPDLPESRMKVRILCAGCSTGEEPYSVTMAFLATLRYPRAWDIEILGGDLNERCIRTAANGYYGEESLRGLPDAYRDRFTEKVSGGISMKEDVKKHVRFSVLNLNDIIKGAGFPEAPTDFAGFDLIFCRNVMIYFSFASQQLLVNLLYRYLLPGGYLFTGDAEALHLYSHKFTPVRDARCLIYRKMETDADVKISR